MFLNDIVTPMTAEEIKKTPVKSTVKEDSPWGSGEGYTGDLWHGTGDAWSGEGGGAGGMPAGVEESAVGTMTFTEWAEAQGDLYKNFSHDSQTYARAKRAYLEAKQTTAETVSSFSNPADTESPIHGEDATSQFVQGPGVDDSQSPIHETRLSAGDPIIVTAPNEFEGKTGEIAEFSPSGSFVVVDLYNHGRHSMHLSDVKYNQYADDEEVDEGFQDFNKVEPYEVCLAGRPVKQFDYYEDARRFHDNWKKKLYREGDKAKADKITLNPVMKEQGVAEAGSPAQQAAIAIAMKKAGKKPKSVDEMDKSQKSPAGWNLDDYDYGKGKWTQGKIMTAKDAVKSASKEFDSVFNKAEPKDKKKEVKEAEGSWIVYDPKTKQIKKRFKTHTAGKSYAQAHKLGFASSEYYFDRVKEKAVAEAIGYESDKRYNEVGPYKRYTVYVGKKKFNDTIGFIAVAVNPRTNNAKFKASGPTQQEAVSKLHAEVDKEIDVATKVSGAATIDFNVDFVRDILEMSSNTFYAKIVPGPKLVIAGKEMEQYPDIMKQEGFKASSIRTVGDSENATKLPAMPLSAGGATAAQLIANGRYALGAETIDKDGNRVFDLEFDSVVADPRERIRMGAPAITIGTKREVKEREVAENSGASPVTSAITRRILQQRLDLLKQYGPDLVGSAVDNVADYVGDVEEIGSSDVSAWVAQVERMLKENPPEAFAEAQTDYQKRRQRERDVDAGRPVSRQPKNPQTDYARKRAQQKRDLEQFGESTNYWDKLQAERNTRLNILVNELKEITK